MNSSKVNGVSTGPNTNVGHHIVKGANKTSSYITQTVNIS